MISNRTTNDPSSNYNHFCAGRKFFTNWYTVTAFRELAINASRSLNKGDRVVTSGRVKVRDWTTDERTGTSIEVEADSLGHDLLWGTSSYEKAANKGSSAHPEGEDDEVVL